MSANARRATMVSLLVSVVLVIAVRVLVGPAEILESAAVPGAMAPESADGLGSSDDVTTIATTEMSAPNASSAPGRPLRTAPSDPVRTWWEGEAMALQRRVADAYRNSSPEDARAEVARLISNFKSRTRERMASTGTPRGGGN